MIDRQGKRSAAPRLLAVTYGGGHVAMLIPVLHALQQRGWDVHVLGLTTAYQVLRELPFRLWGMRDLLQPQDQEAREYGNQLATQMHCDGKVPLEETIAYLGLSYADLVERLGPEMARERFARDGRQGLLPLGPLRRAFRCVQPDVVLSTNSPRAELAATIVARECRIPAIRIVDLFGRGDFDAVPADRVCAPSPAAARELLARGLDLGRIVITGNPAFDRLASGLGTIAPGQAWRKAHGLSSSTILALCALQPGGQGVCTERLGKALEHVVHRSAEFRVAVRPHPSQPAEEAQQFLARLRGAGIPAGEVPLDTLLAACDVTVTCTSTVALEAALLGRRVVLIAEPSAPLPHALPLHEYGWAELASDEQAASSMLLQPRDDWPTIERRGKALREIWRCDGKAAERVAELVERCYVQRCQKAA